MAGQTITVSVLADTKNFSKAMKGLGDATGFNKLAAGAKKVGKALAVAGAAAAGAGIAFGVKAVKAAGDLEQSIGAIDTVFKDNAKTVHKWAKNAATDVGLSRNAYNELATLLGTQLKNGGTALDDLGGKTNELVTLGADLASMFGGDTKTAVEALSSALKGERDPVEKYGVSLKQATIDAKAAEMGFEKVGGSLSNEAQQAATLALIMEQTADAHGNFAKESNTLQGQTQRLKAKFDNIVSTVGMKLIPAVTKVVEWVSDRLGPAFNKVSAWVGQNLTPKIKDLGKWFKDNEDKIKSLADKAKELGEKAFKKLGDVAEKVGAALKDVGKWVVDNKDWLLALGVAVGAMVLSYQTYIKVMATWKAAVVAAKAVQLAFNTVLAANPIGLIVLAIAGLVAGLTFFFTKTETGKKIWQGFTDALSKGWDAIKTAFSVGWEAVKDSLQKAWDFIKKVWSFSPLGLIVTNWNKITSFFKDIPGKIKSIFNRAIDWLKSAGKNIFTGLKNGATETWNKVWTWIKERPGVIKNRFSTAVDWLKSAGKNVFNGLRNGLTERWATVWEWIKGRPGVIRNNWTNAINWLVNAGKNVWNGLKNGLSDKWTSVWTWLKERPGKIKGAFVNAASWLLSAGTNTISGFLQGIKNKAGDIASTIKTFVTDKIPGVVKKALGIKSPSRVMAALAKHIPTGIAMGIKSTAVQATKAMGALVDDVTGAADFSVAGPTLGAPTLNVNGRKAGNTVGNTYNITVNALNANAETGRMVVKAIKEYERLGGIS